LPIALLLLAVEPAFPALTVYTNGITEDRQRGRKIAEIPFASCISSRTIRYVRALLLAEAHGVQSNAERQLLSDWLDRLARPARAGVY